MGPISRQIAEFAAGVQFDDLPHEVVHEVKRFLYDSIGCALGGSRAHDVRILGQVLEELGGVPESTIIGSGQKTSCYHAALLNSLMVRVMDYNDIYWKQDPCHPSDLIPAVLAVAEREDRSGRDLIVGIALAYEFEQRLCEAALPGIRERKWHHASLTQLASPIAAGKMLGLRVEEMINAIGISGCHSMTLGAVTAGKLTMMKNTVDPMAAASGVLAALMAKRGYEGPEPIFEGKEGLFDVLGPDWAPKVLTDELGDSWRILQCSMKAFPTEALTHAPITATLKLVTEHDISPADVKTVTVKTIARAVDILADPTKYSPDTKETADHSLPYVVAAAIVDRTVTPLQFTKERLGDPAIRALLPKVKALADSEAEAAFPERQLVEVTIETASGAVHSERCEYPKGDPRDPMTEAELDTKLAALAHPVCSPQRVNDIRGSVWNLEQVTSRAFAEGLASDL